MVDGLHIHMWNRAMELFAIALSGVRRGCRAVRDGGVDLANVQCKLIQNCHNESPCITNIF
jgi:hypothetical protein